MSGVLTRIEEFQSVPPSPLSMRSTHLESGELIANIRALASATILTTSVVSTTLPGWMQLGSAVPVQGVRQQSPAALTARSSYSKLEELGKALEDAIQLSDALVAEDEAAPLNAQTFMYAVEALTSLIEETEAPAPLVLPLQNGGIGAEWHDLGLNIELQFRKPYHIYTVLEDARGVIPPLHGRDVHLVQARTALREFASRATDA